MTLGRDDTRGGSALAIGCIPQFVKAGSHDWHAHHADRAVLHVQEVHATTKAKSNLAVDDARTSVCSALSSLSAAVLSRTRGITSTPRTLPFRSGGDTNAINKRNAKWARGYGNMRSPRCCYEIYSGNLLFAESR